MNASPSGSATDNLRHLWQLIIQYQGDLEPCYQWLLRHQAQWQPEALLPIFSAAASRWLATQHGPAARSTALRVIATFGNLMQQCPLGNPSAQLELAIAAYTLALAELTPTAHPEDWAMTLSNLATAYYHRRVGSRAANLEQAIKLYRQSLAAQSQGQCPAETWPTTLIGLANAYRERRRGNRDHNLECAIEAYQQALAAIPDGTLPTARMQVMQALAAAYGDRRVGKREDNVEAAIQTYAYAQQCTSYQSF
jgi:hypothetical protein